MTTPICASDLLQRARRAPLSHRDRQRLAAHLAACFSCRLDKTLFADFDSEGSVRPGDDVLDAHLAAALVERLPSGRSSRKRSATIGLLAAAALLTAGVAIAGLRTELGALLFVSRDSHPPQRTSIARLRSAPRAGTDLQPVPGSPGNPPRALEVLPSDRADLDAPADPGAREDGSAPGFSSASIVAFPPGSAAFRAGRAAVPIAISEAARRASVVSAALHHAVGGREDRAAAEQVTPAGRPSASGPPVEFETASSLFETANRQRRAGHVDEALALYRRLQTSYSESRQARISRVSAGRLMLDRGDLSGALAAFDQYLGSSDESLAPEALFGQALAFEGLGRGGEARVAWGALLSRFAESVYAPEARRRLGASR